MNRVDLQKAKWFKSSYSNGNGECVEVADLGGTVATRDTKQKGTGPILISTVEGWRAFIAGVLDDGFDEL